MAVGVARSQARLAGLARLSSEASAVGIALEPQAQQSADSVRDYIRARAASEGYARQWLKKATGKSQVESTRAAKAGSKSALERLAATESSEAFNTGRSGAARALRSSLVLLRVWDAQLDKRTCGICSRADGTIVGLRESFPYGEPGTLHPYDRCSWTLLQSREDEQGTLISPTPRLVAVR
jgi:hypothetical protein